MMATITLLALVSLSGLDAQAAEKASATPTAALLDEARILLKEDEIHQAKDKIRQFIDVHPGDKEAWDLMAQAIDREIAGQRETEVNKLIEEYTERERQDATKTWLERSEALLDAGRYGEALLAAEKVFLFDPENIQASRLMDQIRKEAYSAGKGESLAVERIYQGEIDVRAKIYLEQAQDWLELGRVGAARLALEKVLLLDPENAAALKLYEQIRTKRTDS